MKNSNDTGRHNGGHRIQLVNAIDKTLKEYEEGRGATSCMGDIKRAHEMYQKNTNIRGRKGLKTNDTK